jgi:hypothetical protein
MFDEANSQLLATFKDDLYLVVHFHAVANTAYCDDDDTSSFAECDGPIPIYGVAVSNAILNLRCSDAHLLRTVISFHLTPTTCSLSIVCGWVGGWVCK